MSDSDQLTINQCPVCQRSHKYQLEIKRAWSIGLSTYSSSQNYSVKKEYFTRLFTCPSTEKDFQARFYLTVSSNESIQTVTVKGAIQDETDEQAKG